MILDKSISEIFFISDIHSNFLALASVLKEIHESSIIFCLGDVVGYYNKPNEVCQLLQERNVISIMGNHDEYVLGMKSISEELNKKYMTSWTSKVLTKSNRTWLESLPSRLDIEWQREFAGLPSMNLTLVHGSIFSTEDRLYPDTDLSPYIVENSDIVVCGHTHHPMSRTFQQNRFINPGSVGQRRDTLPGAAYAKLTQTGVCSFHRETYGVEILEKELLHDGFPLETIEMLSRK